MKPLAEHGGDRVEQGSDGTLPRGNIASYLVRRLKTVDNVNRFPDLQGGNSASYLVRRLKRDAPDIAQELAQRRHRRETPQELAADPEVKPLADVGAPVGNDNARKAQELAADPETMPLSSAGGNKSDDISIVSRDREFGTSASYLVRRLKRDAPDIAQELAQRRHRRETPQELAADPEVKPLADPGEIGNGRSRDDSVMPTPDHQAQCGNDLGGQLHLWPWGHRANFVARATKFAQDMQPARGCGPQAGRRGSHAAPIRVG